MAQPYVGEIRMFAGNFAPAGWMFCEGQEVPIFEYETLFNLIGTTYGGNGQDVFRLPDMRGRLPLHADGSFPLAQTGGLEEVTLTTPHIPAHSHPLLASLDAGIESSPGSHVLASTNVVRTYAASPGAALLATQAVGPTGNSQPHSNVQPYLCVNFIISLYGIFPSPT